MGNSPRIIRLSTRLLTVSRGTSIMRWRLEEIAIIFLIKYIPNPIFQFYKHNNRIHLFNKPTSNMYSKVVTACFKHPKSNFHFISNK